MKALTQYINEYLIKKKLDKVRTGYKYTPKTKSELKNNIEELLDKGETNLNCIDTSNIIDMSKLFRNISKANNVNFDVSEWDVSNVKTMSYMFFECKKFDCYLSNWDVSKVNNMHSMFSGCENFTGKGLENWDVSNITSMFFLFDNCINFDCDLSNWDVSNVTDMHGVFKYCKNFTGKGLEYWDVSKVNNMHSMFGGCENFTGKVIENWDVSKVENMDSTFFKCKNFNSDLSNWNVSNVRNMMYMFYDCEKFEGKGIENWDVSKIYKNNMFDGCNKIKKIPDWFYKK